MKTFAPGVISLVLAGYVYSQTFNVAIDMVKRMENLMNDAAQQLVSAGTNPINGPQQPL